MAPSRRGADMNMVPRDVAMPRAMRPTSTPAAQPRCPAACTTFLATQFQCAVKRLAGQRHHAAATGVDGEHHHRHAEAQQLLGQRAEARRRCTTRTTSSPRPSSSCPQRHDGAGDADDGRAHQRRVGHRLPREQEVQRHGDQHEAGGQRRARVHRHASARRSSSPTARIEKQAKGMRKPHSVNSGMAPSPPVMCASFHGSRGHRAQQGPAPGTARPTLPAATPQNSSSVVPPAKSRAATSALSLRCVSSRYAPASSSTPSTSADDRPQVGGLHAGRHASTW